MKPTILAVLLTLFASPVLGASELQVYFIDVEGGQATLFVSPSGQSMLVDTGWPGYDGRDADRIVAAAKLAGVKQIDYLVVTHYHADHVGGVPQLAARIPIRNFVDHGPSVETGKNAVELFQAYEAVRKNGKHILARVGEKIPIRGLDVTILTAAGNHITKVLPGGGANPLCAHATLKEPDPSENAQSVGIFIRYGEFSMIDLGDLTWNKEHDLMCPNNPVGRVDVYLSTHHGLAQSGSPVVVDALGPRVAIMNNGATKGGEPAAWQVIHSTTRLLDLWQLHYAEAGGDANNTSEQLIANHKQEEGNWIKLEANSNGQFTVTNSRNGYSKAYLP